jgi:hypothetical protein
MAAYFLDASALVKQLVEEPGSDFVDNLLTRSETIAVSRLSLVEIASALVRRARAGDGPVDDLPEALRYMEEKFRVGFQVIEVGGAVITRAVDMSQTHALRASDAIQLASALAFRSGDDSTAGFVSSDLELNQAAAAEGFAVIDPREQ